MEKLIIIIVFVGISVIRGLIKTANEKAAKEQRLAQRGDPNRKERVQGEIEAFLSEVGGGGSSRPQSTSPQSTSPAAQQAAERREQRRKQIEAKKQRARRDQEERQRQQQIEQRREETRLRRQQESQAASAPERRVGSGISEHVDQYINQHVAEHIDHDVEEYVEATIVDSVNDNLGTRRGEMPGLTATTQREQSNAAKSVVALLKDPAGVRNAILVNEILSRPRSLRR